MLESISKDRKFALENERHIKNTIEILLEKNVHFSLLAKVKNIDFEPELPDEIMDSFNSVALFVLAGYTFESCGVDSWGVSFEAGFGHENYGSLVGIPVSSILQVLVDDTPILINFTANSNDELNESKSIKRSMEALLSNPENKKLIE